MLNAIFSRRYFCPGSYGVSRFSPYEHKNYSQTQTQLSFSKVCFEKWNFRKISAEIFLWILEHVFIPEINPHCILSQIYALFIEFYYALFLFLLMHYNTDTYILYKSAPLQMSIKFSPKCIHNMCFSEINSIT
jgi:hypothetical protein